MHQKASCDNISISCRKGCSACCSYLVPLSAAEAFRLFKEVRSTKSPERKALMQSFTEGAQKILKKRIEIPAGGDSDFQNRLSDWYAGIGLSCPFMSGGLCTIYQQRPLACREHYVSSSPDMCRPAHGDFPDVVELPVSVLKVLVDLGSKLENIKQESIMLPLSLAWAAINKERAEMTWPAVMVAEKFLETLKENVQTARCAVNS